MPAIQSFRESFPDVSFNLQSIFAEDQLKAFHQGRLDIGLSVLPASDHALSSKAVVAVPPVVALPVSDPLAAKETLEWEDLHGRPQVMLTVRLPLSFSISRASNARRTWNRTSRPHKQRRVTTRCSHWSGWVSALRSCRSRPAICRETSSSATFRLTLRNWCTASSGCPRTRTPSAIGLSSCCRLLAAQNSA